MKLKNKQTGEIKDYDDVVFMRDANNWHHRYHSLAELCEEWEDYKEPKAYWYVGYKNIVRKADEPFLENGDNSITEKRKEIGNYFQTKEEAEKAVEKLKAWKRLKDKDIKVIGWHWVQFGKGDIEITLDNVQPNGEHFKDLDLLFGGEE